MGRRCREDIINEILDVSKNGVRKTQMMRRTNISFGQTRVYLPLLEGKGLLRVEHSNSNGGKPIYITSDKGKEFLQCYKETISYLA